MAKANADKVGSTKKTSTKKPRLGSKSSAKPNPAPKSEEFVVDSDGDLESEQDSPGRQLKGPVPQKSKLPALSKNSAKKAVGAGSTKARSTIQQDPESGSSSDESEDESTDDEGESASSDELSSNKTPAVANGLSAARNTRSSSGDESSEEESEDEENAREAILSARNPARAQILDERQLGDGSSDGKANGVAAKVFTSEPRPVKTFKPPRDFEPITQHGLSPAASQIQSSVDAGRQIWHITAPRDVPLSSIKGLTLEAIANGEAVLSHNNTDYAFMTENHSAKPTQLLLPSEKGYGLFPEHFSRHLHLRQVVKLDAPMPSQQVPSKSTSRKRKREQPAGLKQRFLPIGVVPPTDDLDRDVSEEEEAEQEPAAFRMPPSLPNGEDVDVQEGKERKKRRRDETEGERAARKAAKKAKKAAKAAKAATSFQTGQGSDAREAKVKKKKKDKHFVEAT